MFVHVRTERRGLKRFVRRSVYSMVRWTLVRWTFDVVPSHAARLRRRCAEPGAIGHLAEGSVLGLVATHATPRLHPQHNLSVKLVTSLSDE